MSDTDNIYPCIEEADCISSRVIGCLATDICACDPLFYSGPRCEFAQWGTYVFIVLSIPNVIFASLLFYSHLLEIYSRICRLFSFLGAQDNENAIGRPNNKKQQDIKQRPSSRRYLHHQQIVYGGNRLSGSISDPEEERKGRDNDISTIGYGEEPESDLESYFSAYSEHSIVSPERSTAEIEYSNNLPGQNTKSRRQERDGIIHIKVNENQGTSSKEKQDGFTKKKEILDNRKEKED